MIVIVLLIGGLVWVATVFGGRVARSARLPIAAGIMLGLTGYLLAGSPGIPDAPASRIEPTGFGEELHDPRDGMTRSTGPAGQWLAMSDGFLRMGRTQLAAQTLEKALQRYPRDVDLWVAYGNALVAHAGGIMTPASGMAFEKAAAINPEHPAPPFFAGLAMAQGGNLAGARVVWQQLLDRSPPNAPWREDLTRRLAELPAPPRAPSPPEDSPASVPESR